MILTLLATACLGGSEGGGSAEGGGEGAPGSVTVLAAFVDDEEDRFVESLAAFEEESGVTVEYEGSPDFDTIITTRVQGNAAPDIAIFPQPGLLLDVAETTDALPIGDYLDEAALEESLIPGFLDAARTDEGVFGMPMKMSIKSVLWYPVPEFEEAGYTIPETEADLRALEEQIRSDGGTPWCLGMESADSTGWVGTDWVEEYMLRLHGPDVYDQWVNHEIPFNAPEVTAAWEKFGEIFQTEGNVVGGTQGVLSIPFGESPNAMFEKEPGCWLHRQANFISGFFPDKVQEDLDGNVGAAYFPSGVEGGFDGDPVLGAGDLAMMINDTEAARQLMEFMGTAEFGGPWAEAGGYLSAHREFDASLYPDELTRQLFSIAQEADVLRFDGSDQMPGAVGAGSFWTGIVDWISGEADLEQALTTIEEGWPASGEGGESEATE